MKKGWGMKLGLCFSWLWVFGAVYAGGFVFNGQDIIGWPDGRAVSVWAADVGVNNVTAADVKSADVKSADVVPVVRGDVRGDVNGGVAPDVGAENVGHRGVGGDKFVKDDKILIGSPSGVQAGMPSKAAEIGAAGYQNAGHEHSKAEGQNAATSDDLGGQQTGAAGNELKVTGPMTVEQVRKLAEAPLDPLVAKYFPNYKRFDAEAVAATPLNLDEVRHIQKKIITEFPFLGSVAPWDVSLDYAETRLILDKAHAFLDSWRAAGVLDLVRQAPAGMDVKEQAKIISDYAYWAFIFKQAFWEDDTCKVGWTCPLTIMRKVVALDPLNAEGWLRLANVERGRICKANKPEIKKERSEGVLNSYKVFLERGGEPDKYLEEFKQLNLTQSAPDVCQFYLPYLQKSRITEIGYFNTSTTGLIDIGNVGRKENFSVSRDVVTGLAYPQSDNPATRFFNEQYPTKQIGLLQFEGKYYLSYEDKMQTPVIVEPNVGLRCSYKLKLTPTLTINKDQALCHMLEAGKLPAALEMKKAKPELARLKLDLPISYDIYTEDKWRVAGVYAADIDNTLAKKQIYKILYDLKDSNGCKVAFLAVADDAGHALSNSAMATKLLRVEANYEECSGGGFSPFEYMGGTYIFVEQSILKDSPFKNKYILKMTKSDADKWKLEELCGVTQEPSYTIEKNAFSEMTN